MEKRQNPRYSIVRLTAFGGLGASSSFKRAKQQHLWSLETKNGAPNQDAAAQKEKEKMPFKIMMLIMVLALTEFFTFAAINLLAPFFPSLAEKKEASGAAFGIIIGIFELAALIISPFCIKAVLHVSPKLLTVVGVILLALGTLLFSIVMMLPPGAPFVSVSILLRIFQGVGSGVIDVCSYMVISLVVSGKVSTAIGILEMAVGLGITVGPAIGGVLFDAGGFMLPFLVLGALIAIMIPANIVVFPTVERQDDDSKLSLMGFLLDFEVIICIISITSGGATLGFLTGILEPHLRQFNLSATNVGLVSITTGAVFAITTPLWGYLSDRNINAYLLMITGSLLAVIGFFILGPFPWLQMEYKLWMMLVSLFFCGLGAAAQSICPFGLMLKSARRLGMPNDVTTSALVSAIHITCSTAGNSLGPIVGGFLIDLFEFRMSTFIMFLFEILKALLEFLSWYLLKRRASAT